MKFMTAILVALFPYLHDTTYKVELQGCEPNHIVVVSEGVPLEVTLFNLKMSDEETGWKKTCALLQDAQQLTMQVDPSSAMDEPLAVYLFADTMLVHEELVREQLAYTLIHNPEYTFQKKLLEIENSQEVMAEAKEEADLSYPSYGWVFLVTLFTIWLSCITYLVYKNRKFIIKNTRQKE